MDLQSPSVLAQLPRPLHAATGKTRIGDVNSLADAKKRKRYELAVAVDGEAVNIYNIQTPKLVTSYAVPPQSTFSCRPCSSAVKRQTYTAVTKPEHQIKCFVEEVGNGSSAPMISSSSTTITDSKSPTTFVGIVPFSAEDETETDPFDILAVHTDGRVRRLSSDLKTQHWSIQHSEIAKVCATHTVHSCFLIDLEDAKKGLFKRRQDLTALAFGDSPSAGVDEPSILIIVSHPKEADTIALQDVNIQIFSVPANSKSGSRGVEESQRLKHLQTIQVPTPAGLDKVNSNSLLQWNFHSGTAGLQLSFENGFVNIDLSQYSPSVSSQFVLGEQFTSIMRVSPQCVIAASESLVAVYDTQYQSVQRSIAAKDVVSGTGSNADGPTVFISYFAKLGIAIAMKANTLVAFDLTSLHGQSGPSLKRSRDGLLIDAIGRGIGSSASQWDMSKKHRTDNMASMHLKTPEQAEKWSQFTKTVHEATKLLKPDLFDKAVLSYFGTSEGTKELPQEQVSPESTLFLLSKIFAVQDSAITDKVSASSSSQLRVVLWPAATCDWLIQIGHLSLDNVEIALRRACKPRILQSFPTGSFVQALIDSDSSLKQVNHVLGGPALVSSDELAYALKFFLNQARLHSGVLEETARAITNGDIATPTQELTRHLGSEVASLKDIFTGLNRSLQKIHSQPLASVVKSLRSILSRTELISMVHHLRLSLATGGYTSRFTENPPTPITLVQITPSLSLNTIVDLITASVDAVGPSGWISALPAVNDLDDDSDSAMASASREMELIADMKSEVSAALAGVEEATYLKGILREYLRFADQVADASATSTDAVAKIDDSATRAPSHLIRYEKLNGADLMVFTRPEEGEEGFDGDASGKILPLSLKPPSSDVSRTKVLNSTGEIKARTSREVGYLRRKAAGKYSFERLVI
ncbi:uncharacterized protein N7496_007438 [Penicillium cataractarum]|uniref:Utp8 beta-propeller domain-containing protein n=1 Tax=Penicillium cataractarum TaxID=2100454 RepID=A0A9W9S3K2_9EURO|nr:uncharacterized protein N7496_007438 [Penicillium cataractarum]KAJ5371346.1 hypothetical protein N7496_007438 [Penicillium cataractarum]